MSNKIGTADFVSKALDDNKLAVKKRFGQNFLTDQNVLNNIVNESKVNKDINVIEIGPGLGALTEYLCQKANKVLCYEIDSDLISILDHNLQKYNNYKIINQDILKANIENDIISFFGKEKDIYLVANLPYYITTPIILGLLERTTLIKRYVMMMQEEVADRICSKPDVKDYNALSIVIQYRAKATKLFKVSRNVFYPKPNVDSAVISLDLYNEKPKVANNEELFFKIIRACFAQRRKTLLNNLLAFGLTKQEIRDMFDCLKISENVRSEALMLNDFIDIANYLSIKNN